MSSFSERLSALGQLTSDTTHRPDKTLSAEMQGRVSCSRGVKVQLELIHNNKMRQRGAWFYRIDEAWKAGVRAGVTLLKIENDATHLTCKTKDALIEFYDMMLEMIDDGYFDVQFKEAHQKRQRGAKK